MRNLTKHKFFLVVGLLALGAAGCDDLIEPDITAQKVRLLAPADSTRSTIVTQVFRWEAINGARQYRIRIGGPSLSNPGKLYVDSLVKQTSYARALNPGRYTWQVQAVNDSYATAYASRLLHIDSTGGLSGQTLQLLLPGNNSVSRGGVTTLSWRALPMAQRYLLKLAPNPRGASLASLDTLVGNVTSVNLRIPSRNQVYQWSVSALNASSLVSSDTRRFEVDVLPPPAPTLIAPAASASFLALPITLTWSRGAADVAQDSVFFFRANQTSTLPSFPLLSPNTSFVLASPALFLTTGTYYWAVRSIDRAGNVGPLSTKRPLVLQ